MTMTKIQVLLETVPMVDMMLRERLTCISETLRYAYTVDLTGGDGKMLPDGEF